MRYPALMLKIVPATFAWGLLLPLAPVSFAQTDDNVAVVINDASPASIQIGEHYARARSVPASNVIRILAPPVETIGRDAYSTPSKPPSPRRSTDRRFRIASCTSS